MHIEPITTILANNINYRAKISNITIKDSAAESIRILENAVNKAGKELPNTELTVGKTKIIHSPYMAGYHTENRELGVDYDCDDNNRLYNIFINMKTQTLDNKTLIKTFNYYKGHPEALNKQPQMSYTEFTMIDFDTFKDFNFKEGTEVPDCIADKIKNLIDITIKKLGIN